MGAEARPWIVLVLILFGVLTLGWVADRLCSAFLARRRDDEDGPETERARAGRRAVSGAAFALQQVFDPGIEHVLRAERDAQAEEADPAGDDGDDIPTAETLRAVVESALVRTPIDPEEIRRALTEARREGLDWQALYDEAARAVAAERLYLAPSIPPAARVAPRG